MSQNHATSAHDTRTNDASLGELLRELRDDTSLLLRQEVELAKTEISEKAARVGRNTGYLAAGALVAYAGMLFIILAITAGLSMMLAAAGLELHASWLAPLIVGVVVGVIGYGLLQKGISTLANESLIPEKTIDSLKEDKQWAQSKIN